MKNKLWIFLCIIGGILMIIGSATGSAVFYQFLYWNLAVPYVDPVFLPFIQAILTILEYIAFYGGYSVLVGTFLILISQIRAGKIVITIATSFGMLGLIIYTLTWAISYFSISLNPSLLLILTQISTLFTFNSGTAFTGTVIAVLGRYFVGKFEKEEKESSTKKDKNNGSKKCPNCGSKLPLKANFCNECGKNI